MLELCPSWTGRSALSCVTDSALPRFVTAGTFRTRLSEKRTTAPGIARARWDTRRA